MKTNSIELAWLHPCLALRWHPSGKRVGLVGSKASYYSCIHLSPKYLFTNLTYASSYNLKLMMWLTRHTALWFSVMIITSLHVTVKMTNQNTSFQLSDMIITPLHLIVGSFEINLLLQCLWDNTSKSCAVCPTTHKKKSWAVISTFLHSHEMSLLSRFFYKRPPDGLLEFVDRIYGMHG